MSGSPIIVPVLMPVLQPTTRVESLITETISGRRMEIRVTAAVDVSDDEVFKDVRRSLYPGARLTWLDESYGVLGSLLLTGLIWILIGCFGCAGFIICLFAGIIPDDIGDQFFWPDWLPLLGGLDLGTGLLRFWLAGFPAVLAVSLLGSLLPRLFRWSGRVDTAP